MRGRQSRHQPSELIQVVLDDATVERLRLVAEAMTVELEQLIVGILRRASLTGGEALIPMEGMDEAHRP